MKKERMVQIAVQKCIKAKECGILPANWSPDVVDFTALIDANMNVQENIGIIERHLGVSLEQISSKEIETQVERQRQETLAIVRQSEADAMKSLATKGRVIEKYYGHLRHFVRMVVRGISKSSVLWSDEGGVGKTYLIAKVLADEGLELGSDFVMINSHETALNLYNTLYENRDKLIVLDDVEAIMNNEQIIGMLKAATWSATDKRIVQYGTTSAKREAPDAFEFSGRIIILMNSIPSTRTVQALLTRSLFCEISFTFEEKLAIMREIAETSPYQKLTKDERLMICDHVAKVCTPATKDFNLRTLIKAFDLYRYDTELWTSLFQKILRVDEDKAAYLEVCTETAIIKEQVRKWCEKTGKHRATFYRVKTSFGSIDTQGAI